MKTPLIPENEQARQEALRSYRVLDTAPEPAFDALTTLAAHIAGVPIALVSLVDGSRQWFKSRYGLEAPETPRSISLCGHVVAAEAPLVVRDAFDDERFADNPLVKDGPRLRFYAGMPLRTSDGFVLGTLCAIDHQPRELEASQIDMLGLLAKQVVDQLELRRNNLILQEQTAELRIKRQFFEFSLDLLCSMDGELRLLDINPAGERMLGWTREELKVGSLLRLIHPDDQAAAVAEAARIFHENASTMNFEVRGLHKDGRWIPLSWMAAPKDGVLYASARDISGRKRVERMQTEFVSTVSHELRTPLTSIRGALGLIAAGFTGELGEEAQEYVTVALSNTDRLIRLVNDILDMEKMGLGKMAFRIRRVDLVSAVESAIAANEAFAATNDVHLRFRARASGEIDADDDRLAQILTNLISNAAKFSPQGGEVDVDVEAQDGWLRVSVRDRGPGIAPEFRDRLFQQFAQADASNTRQKGGTGLGLFISKQMTEKMGGRIGFEPAEGGGTTFFVEFPAHAPSEAGAR